MNGDKYPKDCRATYTQGIQNVAAKLLHKGGVVE